MKIILYDKEGQVFYEATYKQPFSLQISFDDMASFNGLIPASVNIEDANPKIESTIDVEDLISMYATYKTTGKIPIEKFSNIFSILGKEPQKIMGLLSNLKGKFGKKGKNEDDKGLLEPVHINEVK